MSGRLRRVFKRHFFIIAAACLVGLMVLAAVLKITLSDDSKGGAGGPGGRGGPGGGRGQAVAEAIVTPREFADQIRVLGVARSRHSVNITSNTTEMITRVLFTDGQRVAAGAPLVELQAREEDADLVQARARLVQAKRDYDRYKTLAERGVAPRSPPSSPRRPADRARRGRRPRGPARRPRDPRAVRGRRGPVRRGAGRPDQPGRGRSSPWTTPSTDPRRFPGARTLSGPLREGQAITAAASADAYPDETFTGRIAKLDTRVDERTRADHGPRRVPQPRRAALKPGMMMRVAVQQGRRQSLAVPEAAVQYEGQQRLRLCASRAARRARSPSASGA